MTQQIIREAPAPNPLEGQQANAFYVPAPNEPILNVNNIQGNILGGFNKDYQALLFLEIENPKAFKHWLKSQINFIATASEVIAFNRLFKSSRQRRGREGTVKATWMEYRNLVFVAGFLIILKNFSPPDRTQRTQTRVNLDRIFCGQESLFLAMRVKIMMLKRWNIAKVRLCRQDYTGQMMALTLSSGDCVKMYISSTSS